MDQDNFDRVLAGAAGHIKNFFLKKIGKKLLTKAVLLKVLPFLIFIIIIFLLIAFLIAAVYSVQPQNQGLIGLEHTQGDNEKRQEYESLCETYNVKDTILLNDTPLGPYGSAYESTPEKPFYPGCKGVLNLGRLVDRYGNDQKLAMKWGQIHAASLFWAYNDHLDKISPEMSEKVANDLHPYFYYKLSTRIVTYKGYTDVQPVYLLVEAYTLEGHYQLHYEWKTKTYGSGENKVTITEEVLKDIKQIIPNKWQRLEDWLEKTYGLSNLNNEKVLARISVWEASEGFINKEEHLAWLLSQYGGSYSFLSAASIPPEILALLKEAEQAYGIPWWFLAGVVSVESSFNVNAENINSGVHYYGLMQINDENWNTYAPRLGFDPIMDKDNPRAQIMVGTYMLGSLGLSAVPWSAPDNVWREQSLPALAHYGGYGKDLNSCRLEYAMKIWVQAMQFKDYSSVWPTPGYYNIREGFGAVDELHPNGHKGIDIAAPQGASVVSVSGGQVKFAGWENPANPKQGFGKFIVVDDGHHLYIYGHLSEILAYQGQQVQPGQMIGAVGSTGRSTGPHLHMQINDISYGGDPGTVLWGRPIDPLLIIVPERG